VPLVIVKRPPTFEQPPALLNVTALPDPPPVAATVKVELYAADPGACVETVIVWPALFTVCGNAALVLAPN
jgi:hypothetical protein